MTHRRAFLQTLGAGTAALAALACGGSGAAAARSDSGGSGGPPPSPAPAAPILVVVQLSGGNDLLDSLVPVGGPNAGVYASARPSLRQEAAQLVDIGQGLALPASFLGMAELYRQGRLALLPGIGMPNPTLSHFLSEDLWHQGAATPAGTGWLGRWADSAFLPGGDPLRGITVDGVNLAMEGATRAFVGISSPDGYGFPSTRNDWGSVEDPAPLRGAFSDGFALGGTAQGSGLRAARAAGQLYDQAQRSFGTLMGSTRRVPAVVYPGDAKHPDPDLRDGWFWLAEQLKFVAEMIAKGVPGQVFHVVQGGFDTHSNHARDHAALLKELGGSLSAFQQDLATLTTPQGPAQERVLVMAWSEFGRRVAENNGGLDHGTAGLAFCLGKGVKGGVFSDYPDLARLDGDGNLKHTVDFRSLYATVLERWLGARSASLLGASYPLLGFL